MRSKMRRAMTDLVTLRRYMAHRRTINDAVRACPESMREALVRAQLEEARRSLYKFGRHREGCERSWNITGTCRCGFEKATRALGPSSL